jgi:hypothetical protein
MSQDRRAHVAAAAVRHRQGTIIGPFVYSVASVPTEPVEADLDQDLAIADLGVRPVLDPEVVRACRTAARMTRPSEGRVGGDVDLDLRRVREHAPIARPPLPAGTSR